MSTPEGKVVNQIYNWLKSKGYMTINMITVKPSGMPDMLVISPVDGEHIYLEIKAEGGRLSPIQIHMHDKLRLFNCKVYTVYSLERVKEIFNGE